MRIVLATLLVLVQVARVAAIPLWTETLDRIDRTLAVQSPGGFVRAELSGRFDLEGYYVDQRPPGLIFGDDGFFANPRLALFLDAHVGRHLYAFVQARFDRGFDPRSSSADARADEYLMRYTPWDRPLLNLQVGKFATMVGNWVPRHDSWNNPFITAPLPYEHVTTVSDARAPGTPAEFLARRDLPDKKRLWVPVIWGPNYTSGVAAFGRLFAFDYALEVKNAALAARPEEWDGSDRGWDEPTVGGRLGWRPAPAWSLGTSASTGPYLRDDAAPTLGRGQHTHDLRETVAGLDAAFARRHLELWSEFFAARFEVPIACRGCAGGPTTDDADTIAYYLEGRYKVTPALFAALRWNQQLFGEVDDGRGGDAAWDRDAWRAEAAVGYRFDRHTQAKVQYGYSRQTGDLQQGEQLVALQLTIRF